MKGAAQGGMMSVTDWLGSGVDKADKRAGRVIGNRLDRLVHGQIPECG